MARHKGSAVVFVLDHGGDVGRIVVQIDPGHRATAFADPARLRPQYPVAGVREALGNRIEIGRAAAERRQEDDERTAALRQHLEAHIVALNDCAGRRLRA